MHPEEKRGSEDHMPARDLFLVPNLLSLLRVFLAPLCFFYLVQTEFSFLPLVITGTVIILSDFLDGALARRLNQSTHLGLVLDPLGDKVCLFAAALALLLSGRISLLFFSIIAAKDLLILLGGIFLIGRRKIIIPSNALGKWTTALFACSIALFVILEGIAQSGMSETAGEGFFPYLLTTLLPWVARGGLLAGAVLAMLSLAGYAVEFYMAINRPLRIQYLYGLCALIAAALCTLLILSLSPGSLNVSPWHWI
jgi:CDP-diacylglycerol--glycerol-3-phosphate 3-phosphatidyltransferase